MKVSDYIVSFLEQKGIAHVFGYPGGMVTHLMDSLSKSDSIHTHLTYHEQGASFCVCGAAQISNRPTVAFATSGPGITNMITGICNAWFDSIPAVFISGQVNTYEGRNGLSVRQLGFQETDIVSIVKSVTKYAVCIQEPSDVCYELEKAFALAQTGRRGPVLLDIPMDIFRSEIDTRQVAHYDQAPLKESDASVAVPIADTILRAIRAARRPCLLLGNGAHLVDKTALLAVVDKLNIPVVTSMPAVDLLPGEHPLMFGFIGAYGKRVANTLLEKSDLLIAMGTRLDFRQTGNDKQYFATDAELIRVDIDAAELENRIKPTEQSYLCDIRALFAQLNIAAFTPGDHKAWYAVCRQIRELLARYDYQQEESLLKRLASFIPEDAVITTDVGQNQVWVAQHFPVAKQRVLFSAGHGAMGYSLPAAIGACLESGGKPTFCFCGDGGLQMNIQELQVLARENLPIHIIVLNNHSLGMIRHFQEMYFDSRFAYTKADSGYTVPDFVRIASAYGLKAMRYASDQDVSELQAMLGGSSPCLVEIALSDTTYVKPKSVYNLPLSHQEPPLSDALRAAIDAL